MSSGRPKDQSSDSDIHEEVDQGHNTDQNDENRHGQRCDLL